MHAASKEPMESPKFQRRVRFPVVAPMEQAIFIAASDMRKSNPTMSKMLFAILRNYAKSNDIELLIAGFWVAKNMEAVSETA